MRRSVLVLALAVLTATGVACSDGADPTSPPSDGAADEALVDPIVSSEGLASCAEAFSVETLAARSFAFDGVVDEIVEPDATDAPYEVAFEVSSWYAGGSGPTVVLRTYDVSGTSLTGDLALEVGDRVLASGEEDFLWGCGFSMPYSAEAAEVFGTAFGG